MYWLITATIGYFIIAGAILSDKGIRELSSSNLEHLIISIFWLPFVVMVPVAYFIMYVVGTFLEK